MSQRFNKVMRVFIASLSKQDAKNADCTLGRLGKQEIDRCIHAKQYFINVCQLAKELKYLKKFKDVI